MCNSPQKYVFNLHDFLHSQDLNKKDNRSQLASDVVTPETLTCGATTPGPFGPQSDATARRANQMNEDLTLKLQQLAGRVSDPAVKEGRSDGDGQREEGGEDERSWKMEINSGEGRVENEKEEEERDVKEMTYKLFRLIAQSRVTCLSSTDDEGDKVGQSSGEWDEDMEEDNKDQEEERTEGLTYKLSRLEKEVRATQFSSTEDELDRVGVDEKKTEEEEEDGRSEALAAKVCRLANQVATQFSSTEDELDRVSRGEDREEVIDDEALWTLQAGKSAQAAQLRDLASLVSASQFSSTEDELDRLEKNEGEGEQEEVEEGGMEINVEMPEVWVGAAERSESFGDLDVRMFDLRDEIEETKTESCDDKATAMNVLDGQTEMEERDEEMKLKSVVEAEKTEEIMRAEQENQPEAKWPDENDKREDRQREEKFEESKEGQGEWEAAAHSKEEDAESDRGVSSMLTLEDTKVETLKDKAAESERLNRELKDTETDESVKTGGENGFKEKLDDVQSAHTSEETGSEEESQSRGDNVRAESAVSEGTGENVTEQTGGDTSREKDLMSRNEQEECERDLEERGDLALETNQMCKRTEVDVEEVEDGGRKMATERPEAEEEGEQKSEEETKEKSAGDTERSGTSSLQEGLLSSEEIQNVSTTAHFLPDTFLE